MLSREPPQINERIPHSAKRRINTDTSNLGNLLKRHFLIIPHEDHFTLYLWQFLHQLFDVLQCFLIDTVLLSVRLDDRVTAEVP